MIFIKILPLRFLILVVFKPLRKNNCAQWIPEETKLFTETVFYAHYCLYVSTLGMLQFISRNNQRTHHDIVRITDFLEQLLKAVVEHVYLHSIR